MSSLIPHTPFATQPLLLDCTRVSDTTLQSDSHQSIDQGHAISGASIFGSFSHSISSRSVSNESRTQLHIEAGGSQSNQSEKDSCVPSEVPSNLLGDLSPELKQQGRLQTPELFSDETFKSSTAVNSSKSDSFPDRNSESISEQSRMSPPDRESQSIEKLARPLPAIGGFGAGNADERGLQKGVKEAGEITGCDWEETHFHPHSRLAIPIALAAVQSFTEFSEFTLESGAISMRHSPAPHLPLSEHEIWPNMASPVAPHLPLILATSEHVSTRLEFAYPRSPASPATEHHALRASILFPSIATILPPCRW